ncbi:unnamed protein product [Rotaria sp. Silwood1]|nr:unnamed protein product [Rotaria sp. Silwood1]
MSIKYRLKRNNGPLNEPIPVHPDAIYRPQNRPMPENTRLATSNVIVPHVTNNNPVLPAPLIDGKSGFSPWLIIGPLLGLLAILALAALTYFMKKKYDTGKQTEKENNPEKQEADDRNINENLESDESTKKSTIQNVTSRNMMPKIISNEQKQTALTSSITNVYQIIKIKSRQGLTNIDRIDHGTSSKIEQENKRLISPLSSIKNIDLNTTNTSDINKEKQQLTLNTDSKYDSLSESSEPNSSSSSISTRPPKEKNSRFISSIEKSSKNILQPSNEYSMINKTDLQKFDNRLQSNIESSNRHKMKNSDHDQSNESTTSLIQSNFTNLNKTISLMPNVPQCKGSTSSDDDEYALYTVNTNNSTIQQTTSKDQDTNKPNSNLNINALIHRKKRTSIIYKSQIKYRHHKDKR